MLSNDARRGNKTVNFCALARSRTRCRYRATVQFDQVFDDGQTKAQAAMSAIGTDITLPKPFEQVR